MWRQFCMATMLLVSFQTASFADDSRILVFGDSNSWGWQPIPEGFPTTRYNDQTRWAGILDQNLKNADIVVDGLVGRRTNIDGAGDLGLLGADDFNGAKDLPEAIARHMPLDLVIIMLGTNDLQSGVNRTPEEVAKSAFTLANLVTKSDKPIYSSYPAPSVLIVSPPPMSDTTKTPLSGLFQTGVAPSRHLGAAFAKEAKRTGIPFFDAGKVTATDGVDGIHLTADNHKSLGNALTPVVKKLLATH